MSRNPSSWDELLDLLEERLRQWDAAAAGAGTPMPLAWPNLGPLPARLEGRAEGVLSRYRDVEAQMVGRQAVLRALIEEEPAVPRPIETPLFVDRRA